MKRILNLHLSSKSVKYLEKAKQRVDAASDSETIRRAITCYAYTLECIHHGAKVQLVLPDGTIETLNPHI